MSNVVNNGKYEAVIFNVSAQQNTITYWTDYRIENAVPIDNGQAEEFHTGRPADADIGVSPFSAGGKLFFTLDGKDYTASAQFCGAKNLVLTAAHCVRSKSSSEWAENILFMRGYKDLSCQKKFAIQVAAIDINWVEEGKYCWDYAFLATFGSADVPSLPYKINSPSSDVTAFGYSNSAGGGYIMKRTEGVTSLADNNIVCMSGNNMRGGNSGGAWVEQGAVTVTGLMAYTKDSENNNVYGPLLTEAFDGLFEYAKSIAKLDVRYFKLNNDGAYVAQMQIKYRAPSADSSADYETYEESGYHDVLVSGERTIDLKKTDIPDGSEVYLYLEVVAGKDIDNSDKYIYGSGSGCTAEYTCTGTTGSPKLKLDSCE